MHTSVVGNDAIAVDVSCSSDALTVVLDDGRTVSVPLVWFPRLLSATEKQRREWEFIGGGIGIHWEEIDEDISVASLLNPEKFMRLANSYEDFPRQENKIRPGTEETNNTQISEQKMTASISLPAFGFAAGLQRVGNLGSRSTAGQCLCHQQHMN